MKIKAGQTVWVLRVRNFSGGNKQAPLEERIEEAVIEKMGRKYFTLKGLDRIKFQVDDLQQVNRYMKTYYIYLSKQEILDEYEYNEKEKEIISYFRILNYSSEGKLPLKKLRAIYALIFSEGPDTRLSNSEVEIVRTALGENIFIRREDKRLTFADTAIRPSKWNVEQLRAIADYMEANPDCSLFKDGSGRSCC